MIRSFRLPTLLLTAGLLALGAPAAGQTTVLTDSAGITGAELFGDGLFWWNSGNCGEILIPGTVRTRSTINGGTNLVANDCFYNQGSSTVDRDENYVYFVSGNAILRKSATASESDPPQVVDTAPFSPALPDVFGSPLVVFEDHLYWFRTNTGAGTYSLIRKPLSGGQALTVLTRTGPRPFKLDVIRYGDDDTLAYLWIENDGDLFVRRLAGFLTQDFLLSTHASDFEDHSVTAFVIGQGAVKTTSLYVSEGVAFPGPSSPSGAVKRINLDTLASTTLFTSAGDNQVLSIATDSDVTLGGFANVYIMEAGISCGAIFCSPSDVFARRRRISGGIGVAAFQLILASGGGGSLSSDDEFIYWVNGNSIRKLATDAPPIQIDWEAIGVEVVQNVQSLTHDTRMVTGKRTFARGYAKTKINNSGTPIPVSAYLRGFRGGNELPESPLQSLGTVVLPTADTLDELRGDLEKSLLWELPDSWTTTGNLTVRLEIDGTQATPETGPTSDNMVNNVGAVRFEPRGRPCILHRPVSIAGAPNYYGNSDPNLTVMQRRATSLLPIETFRNRFDSEPITEPEFVVEVECAVCFPFYCCAPVPQIKEGPFEFDGEDDDGSEALFFTSLWSEFSNDPDECEADIHYLGAVHPNLPGCVDNDTNTSCFNGVAYRPSDDLLVRMEPDNDGLSAFNGPRGGRTLAHELGHNYGRKHIDCGGPDGPHDDPPFDDCDFGVNVPDFEITHFGFDPVTRTIIRPGDAGDLMSYSGDRWISKHNWDRIWNETSTEGGLFAFGAGGNATGPHVYIYGRADALNGEGELLPAYVLPDGSYDAEKVMRSVDAAALIPASSPWTLEVRDAQGGVLYDTMALVFESSDAPDKPAGFAQYLPFPAGATSVHLLFQGTSVASQTASGSPPQLALDPLSLDVQAQQLVASWSASDADGDTLRFTLHYSADDGVSWKLLRLNYGALSATLDTSLLAGSTSARIRVLASDGLNTTEAVSPPFNLPTHTPTVMIGGVMDGQELPFGSDVQLLGMGVDAEDGSLPGSSLDWNVLGPPDFTGTGSDLTLPDLIPGPYSVDLLGTDSDGDTGTAMLDFSVAPVLIPEGSAPSLDGFCGDGAYRQAVPVRLPFGAGGNATARLIHAGSDLFVCVTDLALPFLPFFPASFSLRVEVDGLGDANPEPGDRGFRVDSDGDPFQELVGRSGGFTVTQSPSSGYAARIKSGAESWSAEMRIDEGLIGGWDGLVRMSFRHGNALWPPAHDVDSPATYGMVQLGETAPPLPNLAPVAVTGPDFAVDLVDAGEVHLDGSNSFDADGDPLGFSWSQTGGPPVTLVDADTSTPVFALLPSSPAGVYRFELIVDDGSLPSAPATQVVTINRADPAPQSTPDLPQLPAFVTVGDPGNDEHPDFRFGDVAELYQARTTEVTNAEYMMFLQAVARSDPAGLWDPAMGSDPRGGITRTGVDGAFVYEIRPLMMFKPVNFVDWFDAARYVNWLENGSPTAPQGPTTTEDGVYDMSQSRPSRAPGSNYRLPTEDEWFKAAFQDPGAAGGWRQFAVEGFDPTPASVDGAGNTSNSNPDVANYGDFADWNAQDGNFVTVGTTLAPSFWGTYEQSGNVAEWTESESRRRGRRVVRGGDFSSTQFGISIEGRSERPDSESRADLGFRVFRGDTTPPPDSDGDGIPDTADNCTDVPNPSQADANAGQDDDSSLAGVQHYGNACDPDFDDDGQVTPSDFFAGFRPCIGVDPSLDPVCAGADFDGDGVVGAADFFGTFRPSIGGAPGPGIGSP